ncbi:M20/M25/M40 family metallo-hydrolase [Moheibacter stercoris]|uniref:Leucyl aminopeptidase n=1 Tax=Moheibacter stercoris TaxID=1628251 RepID=A0ABV2LVE4_9FLAO
MKKFFPFIWFFLVLSTPLFAQKENWTYATTSHHLANALRDIHPRKVQIQKTENGRSVVFFDRQVIATLDSLNPKKGVYTLHSDKRTAIQSMFYNPKFEQEILEFTVTEHDYVQKILKDVNPESIGQMIKTLENYGTRFHTRPEGIQASIDLKNRWEKMALASKRSDIKIEFFEHDFSPQKSIIITIPGQTKPDEIVILGGHLDSGDSFAADFAPGADDNGSGIATLTEIYRVLLKNNFKPQKTVQIMAFAAEEVGLLGAKDIAETYSKQGVNVLGMMNLDMVTYKGSDLDIYLTHDPGFTSSELNVFLFELLAHYHSSEKDLLTFGLTECGYDCSDHAAWGQFGYKAVFPFEADGDEMNPWYHSEDDTFENMGNDASHAAKFAKLGLEFVVEIAKNAHSSVKNSTKDFPFIRIEKSEIIYESSNESTQILTMEIINSVAEKILTKNDFDKSGRIKINSLEKGVYLMVMKLNNGKIMTKKFVR